MKKFLFVLAAAGIALTGSMPLAAQDKPVQGAAAAQAPSATKDAKPDPNSVAGRWHLTMPRMGAMSALQVLDITVEGKKVKGTLTSVQMGEIPFKGEFSNNKLKFTIDVDMGPQSMSVDFEGKLKDGELSGTVLLGPLGEAEWKATRPPGGGF